MQLALENIGKLSTAEIALNGITVIAGENNTGKSTVGKALYCIFNSFYDVENRIEALRKESIVSALNNLFFNLDLFSLDYDQLIEHILAQKDTSDPSAEVISSEIHRYMKDNGIVENNPAIEMNHEDLDRLVQNTANRILDILIISKDNLFKNMLDRSFEPEFRGQICNLFADDEARVRLTIKNETVTVTFLKNRVKDFEKRINLKTEVIYIDDPYVLDNGFERYAYIRRRSYAIPHRNSLNRKIRRSNPQTNLFDEIVVNKKLEKIYNMINNVCEGELLEDSHSLSYSVPGALEAIDINNVSTGLKTFVIIKSLLQNGEIGEKSTIILDEPEIHLHPEWQILFAEIIVLLQKEFDMTILINTHSPYFLEAIEVYSEKYKIKNKCKYYLAENAGEVSSIKDVTEKVESIYKKLAEPFQKLENARLTNE